MRTTMDLDADALMAAKELARVENTSLGKVVSRLIRRALTGDEMDGMAGLNAQAGPPGEAASRTGFVPFAPRGSVVSNALIDHLRDAEGV
ncbi:MAG: hypothetical protein Q4A97_03695 [Comamonadaceae bacterium]|nr:hypothetical protein [Comamonadaceae bacterium]